jgi:hypothetical protein
MRMIVISGRHNAHLHVLCRSESLLNKVALPFQHALQLCQRRILLQLDTAREHALH